MPRPTPQDKTDFATAIATLSRVMRIPVPTVRDTLKPLAQDAVEQALSNYIAQSNQTNFNALFSAAEVLELFTP